MDQFQPAEPKNSLFVFDKLNRSRVFSSRYWREECFALDPESVLDKASKLNQVGAYYGGTKKPTKFICLLMKMLQMNLNMEMAQLYLQASEYKYLTALTLLYIRLICKSHEVFELLEPYYSDNRKLRLRDLQGKYQIIHLDEFVDKLLREQTFMGVTLPFLQKRLILEELETLPPRKSILEQMGEEGIAEILGNNIAIQPKSEISSKGKSKIRLPRSLLALGKIDDTGYEDEEEQEQIEEQQQQREEDQIDPEGSRQEQDVSEDQ